MQLNSTLDQLLSSKFSKITTAKGGGSKDSMYLGSSGMQGLFDMVDQDKLVQTLGSEMK